jgi:hypothetical protein
MRFPAVANNLIAIASAKRLAQFSLLAKYLWAGPLTLSGLALATVVRVAGGRWVVRDGVVETSGWLAAYCLDRHPIGRVAACAIGHVVIGRDNAALERTRAHEREHVRQAERWGVLFPLAYIADSLWQWMKGKNLYWDNRFERAAREVERMTDEG